MAATCPHFIKEHGSIAIMEPEAEPSRNLKWPSPQTHVRIKMRRK